MARLYQLFLRLDMEIPGTDSPLKTAVRELREPTEKSIDLLKKLCELGIE